MTRAVLRRTSGSVSFVKIVLALVSTLAVALLLMGPLFIAHRLHPSVAAISYLLGASNFFDVGLALFFGFLVSILLVHRALWPLLTRTLFRMQDIGTKGRRGILMSVGLALLGWSGVHLTGLVKEMVKILGT
jgi:hypothetical protein